MADPPAQITVDYVRTCERAASAVQNPVQNPYIVTPPASGHERPLRSSPGYSGFNVSPKGFSSFMDGSSGTPGSDSSPSLRNSAFVARNNLFEMIDRISAFVSRSSAAGSASENNPFSLIAQHNEGASSGSPDVSSIAAAQIMTDIGEQIDLMTSDANGELDRDGVMADNVSQISSVNFSLEAIGGSGEYSLDLMSYGPSMREIQSEKARLSSAILDFTKNVPTVLFVADYRPVDEMLGTLVGFKKIPSASGYVIKKRNLFTGEESETQAANESLQQTTDSFVSYANSKATGFYDKIDPSSVYLFYDRGIVSDSYFFYWIQAYQVVGDTAGIFVADTSNVTLTPLIQDALITAASSGSSAGPWPILSRQLLGDERYDWVLSGLNVRASMERNETFVQNSKFGYLQANLQDLIAASQLSHLVVPKDPGSVIKNLTQSVTSFGATQVLLQLLQDTGILFYFDGIVPNAHPLFTNVQVQSISDSQFLSAVASATDPETYIVDLSRLTTNLQGILVGATAGAAPNSSTGATEIVVPPLSQAQPSLPSVGSIKDAYADLTTAEGLGMLIRTIRVFVDGLGNGVSPSSSA